MKQTALRDSLAELHSASFHWATLCCRGNRQLAEDVLQSVYVSVFEGRARFDDRSSLQTWLFAVIRNAARNHHRQLWWSRLVRLKFDQLSERIEDTRYPASLTRDDEEIALIRQALAALPHRQRQVIHLVFYEGLSLGEAAEVMGVSSGTASQHYARAKAKLKTQLHDLENRFDETRVGR